MEYVTETMADVYTQEELEHIRERNGYAIGTVTLFEDGEPIRKCTDAVIELFNGDAGGRGFGGVRFVGDGGAYQEAYAYASRGSFDDSGKSEGWVVTEWVDPEDPNYGREI